jgi:hypothetical protein
MTTTVDDFRSIDIAWFMRTGSSSVGNSGIISWSRAGSETGYIGYKIEHDGIRLRYQHTQYGRDPTEIDECIPIATTPMHFGGHRSWFTCLSCGRRCRILYGGERFRCRLCYGAKYKSQYQHPAYTTLDQRWRIRRRLEECGGKEWPFGLDAPLPPKPPRMHWNTYEKLEALDKELHRRGEGLIRR